MLAGSTFRFEAEAGGSGAGNSWDHCSASNFELRVGPNYDRNKQKAPSAESLMELVGVDLIRCSARIDHIASKVTFPKELAVPRHFTVPSCLTCAPQLPSEFATSFFTEEVSESLAAAGKGAAPPSGAAQLWARYCDGICSTPPGSTNPWIGRFKVIITCLNIERYGLPNFIASYNSKPVLIRNTASYFRQDGYVEIDINVHRFGSVPKKALQTQIERLHIMEFNIGFCIESRNDDEMPECIFGCARLNRANQNAAPDWNNIPIAPPLSMQEKFISPIHAAESIDDNQEKPRRDVDHGTFRLVSFMRHRNTLLEMWNLLAGQDTSFGGKSPTDEIASLDLVCPAGEGSERNPIYRQCGKTGEVVQHMNELFEAAEIVKPMFEASLIRIATECSLSTTGRASSTSPTSTRSGLVISKIKSVARVAEKIREKYLSVSPGPACSWVFDVLRASFVCDSQEQIFHVYEALRDDPDIKIIRVKNRFLKPTPAGFRDILVNVQMTSPGLNGCTFNYACEVQITHVDLRQYEIEHDTRALYQVFWPLLTGTEENACKKLTLILKIISLVTPFVESLVPLAVEKRISQVEDILKKHYDDIYLRDDIESLRDWTPVLESINNLPLAEKNQRKVIQLVSQLHGKASIAVAYENMHLGHILQLKKKYGDSFSCYATGIKCIASVLGKASAVVEDTVLVLATLRNLERNVAEVTESDVNKIRLDIFGTGSFLCGNDSAVDSSIADDLASCLLVRQHSETHHSAYDSAPLNYSTKPPEMLLPIPDLWDLVSSSDSEFDNEEDSNHHS